MNGVWISGDDNGISGGRRCFSACALYPLKFDSRLVCMLVGYDLIAGRYGMEGA